MIKHLFKYRYIAMLLVIVSAFCIYLHSLPPNSKKDTLQVMHLKSDATATFRLESQLHYDSYLISQLKSSLMQASNETSHIDTINISILLENDRMPFDDIISELTILSNYMPQLRISLIPSDEIDEMSYMNIYTHFTSSLIQKNNSSIEFIYYPKDLSSLEKYNELDGISSIGININGTYDLKRLDILYNYFKGAKRLYINENLLNMYNDDIIQASKEINAVYYTLAIRYPECSTIFSPFIKSPFETRDDLILTSDNPNYMMYHNIYGRLLNEPWLTLKDVSLATTSPYELLDSYDILTGIEEILLAPTSTLLLGNSTPYSIHFRTENQEIAPQNYYPYVVKIDTFDNPNGITRLKAINYDNTGEIIQVQSIDLVIQNSNNISRAERSLKGFPITSETTYGSKYIPILMYHSITDTVSPEQSNICVETKLFDAQMKALIDNGYTPINFKILLNYVNGIGGLPDKPILITMDDGYLDNYTNAYPIYKKYNISATIFVSPYYMEETNTDRHFGWVAAKEMESSGLIDIQSHGYDHTPLSYLSLKDVRYHVSHSKGLIEKYLGSRDVFVVAYPQFRNTIYTRKLLSQMGVDFQITKLAKRGTGLKASNLKRINVPNTMSPEELIATLENLTQ